MSGNRLELVKSAILAALVVISVFLTGYLWFGFTGRYASAEPTSGIVVTVRSGLNPGEFLMPSRIVLHQGNETFALLQRGSPGYEAVWKEGKMLGLLSNESLGTATGEDADAARRQGLGVEFFLPTEVSFAGWLSHWGVDAPREWDFPTSRVFLTDSGKRAFVRVDSGEYMVIPLGNTGALAEVVSNLGYAPREGMWLLPREVAGLSVSDGVYVPMVPPEVSSLIVEAESADVNTILSRFFIDPSVVRRIEEHDGATIYTDGRIGLRVYPGGALEYSMPLADQGSAAPDLLTALERAADFVAQYGAWPEGPFLTGWGMSLLGGTTEGLTLRFSYSINGQPVSPSVSPIEVSLGSTGVVGYRRNVLVSQGNGNDRRTVRPVDALRVVWKDREGKVEASVTDIYLGYYTRTGSGLKGVALPVWVVCLEGARPVMVDAHSGRVIEAQER